MKRILLILGLVILGIQFVRIDYSGPMVSIETDFISMTNPPEEIEDILRSSCYDCHSNQTKYPWYSQIAPVSWWIADHIKEGREELNFSLWGTFSEKRKSKKLHEIIEEVEEGEMPLSNYLITHSDAELSKEKSDQLIEWVKYLEIKKQ